MTSRLKGYKKGEPHRYCCGHYKRPPRQDYAVDPDTGCWRWWGALHNGYGRTRVNGRVVMAHRAFYERFKGPIPDGYVVDHLCGVRSCVNPEHLEAVPPVTNIRRGAATKLTLDDARHIRRTLRDLAERYGVSIRTLANVAEGKTWPDP